MDNTKVNVSNNKNLIFGSLQSLDVVAVLAFFLLSNTKKKLVDPAKNALSLSLSVSSTKVYLPT